MNPHVVTLISVFIASALSTTGASWLANQSREATETKAINTMTSELSGMKGSVEKVSGQMMIFSNKATALEIKVESLEDYRTDSKNQLRDIEAYLRRPQTRVIKYE